MTKFKYFCFWFWFFIIITGGIGIPISLAFFYIKKYRDTHGKNCKVEHDYAMLEKAGPCRRCGDVKIL